MLHLSGFQPLASQFDGFIFDLWGVIHDGVKPYPGAAGVLVRLRELAKPAVLLSNAPRRGAAAQKAMRKMGLADDLYDQVVTSGEVTHMMLRDRTDPWFAALGRRLYHLGPPRDRNVFDGLDYERVTAPENADFLLNTGPDDERDQTTLDAFIPELEACFQAGLPMISANPDLEVIRDGKRVLCAGSLAALYESWGGVVRSIGKPDPAVFQPAMEALARPRDKILMVGDSLRTDIAGAKAAGIASCWVLGGIHGETLGLDPRRVEAEAASAGLTPYATVPSLIW